MTNTLPDPGSPFPRFDRENVFMFDPDRPHETANELAVRMGGNLEDPHKMNHNCGFCHKTMNWELFTRHMAYCHAKWRKVTLNTKHRIFTGATPYLGLEEKP